jgi:hypothetical protein
MPYGYENDRPDQRSNNGDTRNIDVANTINDDDVCHQPYPDERCDDSTDEAERQSPADNSLSYKTDNSRDYQVNDEVEAEAPNIVTDFDGDPICENQA